LFDGSEKKMAEEVRIKNGNRELTVSVKAFQTIYAAKGFTRVAGEVAAAETAGADDDATAAPAPRPKAKAKRRANNRTAAKRSEPATVVDLEAADQG
jgi:hypothetical protein